ncbi:MAG: efflux RND transporter periplasmic adaptor subunit [Saprospiraceae bacterium]|nr:efflux RND transporter periplasmic adaptor subunit [Saprospiraceae bacterium]
MKNDMRLNIIILTLLSLLAISGCKNEHQYHQTESGSYYTCPMHPSVVSSTPGSCPVCNMSLIKVERKENKHLGQEGNFITIEKRQQELAGIKIDTVRLRSISSVSTIIGTVAIDEEQVKVISSRAKGRIDKLFVKSTGFYLKIGSPLYSIYSEQLQSDKKEYLSLIKNSKSTTATSTMTNDFLSAAKNKLLLWGMTEKQIADIENLGNTGPLITFFSSVSGYVIEVNITEGMYVDEGTTLLKTTSLNQLWVEAQLYSNEISSISENKTFQIFSESNPEKIYKGTLVYNNPIVEDGKRIQLFKIRINNSGRELIPGTLVTVIPEKSLNKLLAVPKSAVLLEKMKTVWVLAHENTFEQRMVKTGAENNNWIEIVSGLKEGDIIVTEGSYLISSEFILKSGAGQRHDH